MYYSEDGYEGMNSVYGVEGNPSSDSRNIGLPGSQGSMPHSLPHHHQSMYMPQHMMNMSGPPSYIQGPQSATHSLPVHLSSMSSHPMSHLPSSQDPSSIRSSAEIGLQNSNRTPVFYQGQPGIVSGAQVSASNPPQQAPANQPPTYVVSSVIQRQWPWPPLSATKSQQTLPQMNPPSLASHAPQMSHNPQLQIGSQISPNPQIAQPQSQSKIGQWASNPRQGQVPPTIVQAQQTMHTSMQQGPSSNDPRSNRPSTSPAPTSPSKYNVSSTASNGPPQSPGTKTLASIVSMNPGFLNYTPSNSVSTNTATGYQDASGVYIPSSALQHANSNAHHSLVHHQIHPHHGAQYHQKHKVNPMDEYIAASLKRRNSLASSNQLSQSSSGSDVQQITNGLQGTSLTNTTYNKNASQKGVSLSGSISSLSSSGTFSSSTPKSSTSTNANSNKQTDTVDWPILDISSMQLNSVSPLISIYSHLSGVYLQHNRITTLPVEICTLVHLKFLDLSYNQLAWLPAEIGQLVSLKELFLSHNQLKSVPLEMGKLFRLVRLTLDDNPLQDLTPDILARGAPAVVSYLRDLLAPLDPPPPRSWTLSATADRSYVAPGYFQSLEMTLGSKSVRTIENGHKVVSIQAKDHSQFRIDGSIRTMCYNILADVYAMSLNYCPTWALSWNHRKSVVLKEIDLYEPDILCLQEVELGQYRNFFLPEMSSRGYLSNFHPKTRVKYATDVTRVDGCASFYRQEMFEEVQRFNIEFQTIARENPDRYCTPGDDAGYNRLLAKDNIAVGFVLRRLDKPSPATIQQQQQQRNGNLSAGKFNSQARGNAARRPLSQAPVVEEEEDNLIILVNTHIHWDPDFSDVKLMQVQMLLEQLEDWVDSYSTPNHRVPVILGGDFNSMPDSGVYALLSTGFVPGDHPEFLGYSYGAYTAEGLRHGLELRSSNGSLAGEPEFTNYTGDFAGVLDYIWYTDDSLHVERTLNGVDESTVVAYNGALPNPHMPSDHIPLVSDFVQCIRR